MKKVDQAHAMDSKRIDQGYKVEGKFADALFKE
jgi:hypothetical protein